MARTNSKTYETSTPTKVAFIGLGVMGYPMAGHLALAGHHVTVYNRNPAKAADWCAEFPASQCAHPTSSRSRRRHGVLLRRQR
jgi:3-hydroxyisobutyrate dehydrogenase